MKLKKYLQTVNENSEDKFAKTRVLLVTGGDDYHALRFEENYSGTPVVDIINNISEYESDEWELKTFTFGSIDPKFILFIRNKIQDYDDSKTKNFYIEGDIIK